MVVLVLGTREHLKFSLILQKMTLRTAFQFLGPFLIEKRSKTVLKNAIFQN